MASILELPNELWLYIAEMLEPEDRRKLVGLNRLFFEIVMDDRYRNLSLVSPDTLKLIETVDQLSTPVVTRRVRKLTIWPQAVCQAIYTSFPEGPRRQVVPVERDPSRSKKRSRLLQRIMAGLRMAPTTQPAEIKFVELPPIPPPCERLELLANALTGLQWLEELSIDVTVKRDSFNLNFNLSSKYPLLHQSKFPTFLTQCMQQCIWPAVRTTVHTLALNIDNSYIADTVPLLPALIPLNVRHLDLKLWTAERNGLPLSNALLPFLRLLNSSRPLETLKLQSECDDFWGALHGEVSDLRELEVRVPERMLTGSHPKHSPIHKLLSQNRALERLAVLSLAPERGRYSSLANSQFLNPVTNYRPAEGGGVAVELSPLPNLESLKLKLPIGPDRRTVSECDEILEYFAHICQGIVCLSLEDGFASSNDLRPVLNVFSDRLWQTEKEPGRLQDIRLRVLTLTPGVVETIISRCRGLVKLHLEYNTLRPQEPHPTHTAFVSRTLDFHQSGFMKQIYARKLEVPSAYSCPTLRDISIMGFVQLPGGLKYNFPLMMFFAEVFPSIESFAGGIGKDEKALVELEPKYPIFHAGSTKNSSWT